MTTLLVTGGAGYVGSHTVRELERAGVSVVVLDDLSEGHRGAVIGSELIVGDCTRRETLDEVLSSRAFDGVVHFAARAYVGESVSNPRRYWRMNAAGTLTLLEALVDHAVPAILFSSSCTVYGERVDRELVEALRPDPVNPYGRTKAAVEWMLEDFGRAYGLRSMALRYFNAAGADPGGELGEDHDPETHLVPLVIREALTGRQELRVFGTDYPTPDGTCIRDYVHVTDLADAHKRGIRHLLDGGESATVNLGTGRGCSVLEVIGAVEARSGTKVRWEGVERRAGDPAALVARPGRAKELLGWEPTRSGLEEIVDTAYRWHESHPEGYP